MSSANTSNAAKDLARLSALEPPEAQRELKHLVFGLINEFLSRGPSDGVKARDRFVEIGFDSLRATDFVKLLVDQLLCELSPTLLFDYPTPEALVAHLADRVLDLPAPESGGVAAETDEGLAEEVERVAKLSEAEARVLLARNTHRLRRLEREQSQPIAIVGMACRFPAGIDSPEALWRLLDAGGSCIEDAGSRWPMDDLYHSDRNVPGRMNTRRAGMLNNVYDFDARFFNISPKEASELDPQQRLLLEVSWEALERANIPTSAVYGRPVGVFVGMKMSEYYDGVLPEESGAYRATGTALSTAAGRISYTLGLTGPCFPVDTACSSSLVSVHLAVASMRRGECTLALAGGVSITLDPSVSVGLSKANMLAPDGKCKTFDASANGYVRAENCAMVVLKPLARALADGDHVHAVIRGTAINQDGATGGLTVPSGPAQEAVIRMALANAQVQPYQVGYIEAHGTGTELGDPIEVAALENVFGGPERFHQQPLIVGSGKTNYGHMETGAGIAGILRVVLALENEKIPKNLYFDEPNPRIPWDRIAIKVAKDPVEWRRGAVPRIAGLSSFGFSGTNAHAVIEEAPLQRRRRRSLAKRSELVPLSARAESDLGRLAARYADALASGELELGDVAFTAAVGRAHEPVRAAFVADDLPTLVSQLRGLAADGSAPGVVVGRVPSVEPAVAFLFTGQGAQRAGMGRDLYETEKVFRETLDRCAAVLDEPLGVPLVELLWGRHTDRLNETRYTQPAMVAFQVALVSLWTSWGIRPRWVLGHSIGEISAAWSSGVLTLEQALNLAQMRGRLMDELEVRGAMAAIQAAPREVEVTLAKHGAGVAIAAYNGPKAVVISGPTDRVEKVSARMREKGARVTPLQVSHAFHSPLMEPMLKAFRAAVGETPPVTPTQEWISTLTPGATPAQDADYWVRHVREPVRFSEGMELLARAGCRVFLEVGPSSTLLAMGRECVDVNLAHWIASQHAERDGRSHAIAALGQLYVAGVEPRWHAVYDPDAQKIDLPTYPFKRKTYTRERIEKPMVQGREVHPLVGVELPLPPLPGSETIYSNHLSARSPAYLVDHRAGDVAIFPAAAYVEAALALIATRGETRALTSLTISTAMGLDERGRQVVTLARDTAEGVQVQVQSRVPDGAWTTHAAWSYGDPTPEPPSLDLRAAVERCGREMVVEEVYEAYAGRGLPYGEAFRGLRRVLLGEGEVIAQVAPVADPRYRVHPAVLDACFQAAGVLVFPRDEMLLPVGIERAVLHRPLTDDVWCRATIASEGEDFVVLHVGLFDADGRPTLVIEGLRLVETTSFAAVGSGAAHGIFHSTTWVEVGESSAPERTAADAGAWLILSDEGGLSEQLVMHLDEKGVHMAELRRDQIDLTDAAAVDEAFSDLGRPCTDVVCLWALDEPPAGQPGDAALHEHRLAGLLRIVQSSARAAGPTPKLTIVTRGGQQISNPAGELDLSQAPLWGFAAALALEVPALRVRCIDLAPAAEERDALRLLRELWQDDGERRVAFRGGRRYVARLAPGLAAAEGLMVPPGPGFALRTSGYGTLQNLYLRPMTPRPPGPGEVQVQVAAAALNFKDVLHAMGVLKEWAEQRGIHTAEDQPLGLECAGRISAVGPGVEGFALGDEVMAMTDGTLASHVTLRAAHVGRKPEGWELTEAAGLQAVFFTAAYSLLFLAKVRPGERVLVQSAAGGVGQAAVQICHWIGAEVFATASEPKWGHLQESGVKHVMNSRTVAYSKEILALTNGRGVDVVLNSLADEHIPRSLAALAKGGRFIEIGKKGIWEPERVAAMRPDVTYHAFDMADTLATQITYAELTQRLSEGFATGRLHPIPTKVMSLRQAQEAFQLLASGKTIGKIVLSVPPAAELGARAQVRSDRSYIISGGLGALGLETASWLVRRNAGAVVLLGRRDPDPAVAQTLKGLRGGATQIRTVRVDAADARALERALDEVAREIPPVGGIVHAAGLLADALVEGLDWERMWTVMAPKVAGGWNLHRWSEKRDLDWFVSYASVASVLGSAGQTAYAAANAFLEGLAHERRRRGLPGTSIHWGAWAGGGMAAVQPRAMRRRLRRLGLAELGIAEGIEALDTVLAAGNTQALVAAVSWPTFMKSNPAEASTFLSLLGKASSQARGADSGALRSALLAADEDQRAEMLFAFTRRQVASIVGVSDANEITLETQFAELGVDSLLALDLRTLLERGLQTTLASTIVFDHPSLGALVTYLDGVVAGFASDSERTT